MGTKIECREDKQDVAGEVSQQNEEAILTDGIALEISHDKSFEQKRNYKGDRQPDQWRALEKDQQDAVNDAREDIHDQGDGELHPIEWTPS
jgi:hypothetical protein